jgi:DNA polymerase (family 10)
MMQVPDMGPKKAKRLWEELGIDSVAALRTAAEAGQLRDLKGFGAKSEEKILKGIELLAKRAAQGADERTPIGVARPLALRMIAELQARLPAGAIERIEIAGSLRRWKETIGDVDILCVSAQPALVMEPSARCPKWPTSAARARPSRAWCWATASRSICAWSNASTGARRCNTSPAARSTTSPCASWRLKQGWSLNEYGLTATGAGDAPEGERRFFEEEADLYAFLGLDWAPPELRENRGEVAAARQHACRADHAGALQGELHSHTTWSDGVASVAEMAETARARGYATGM